MLPSKNAEELLRSIALKNLYIPLIQQLNKDFLLSNLNMRFEISSTPEDLKRKLSDILLNLVTNRYDDYLNFVYRVDVSEKDMLKIKGESLPIIIEQLTFIILKREYQKVWFKSTL